VGCALAATFGGTVKTNIIIIIIRASRSLEQFSIA
jgi:hypothetical protein